MRGTESTLQNRCFVPACPCWPFAMRGLPLWGCQSASLQEGPPWLPIHWRSKRVAFLLLIGLRRRGPPATALPTEPSVFPTFRAWGSVTP